MLETLIHFDESISIALHEGLKSGFSDVMFGFLGNLWFWVPFFVFVAILTYGLDPKRSAVNLTFLIAGWFAAATFASFIHILIFQLSSLETAELLFRLRPGRAGTGPWQTTFPDPHATSFTCILTFLWMRVVKENKGLRWLLLFIPLLFLIAELYTFKSFTLDILLGIVTGILAGVAVVIVANGIENVFLTSEE